MKQTDKKKKIEPTIFRRDLQQRRRIHRHYRLRD